MLGHLGKGREYYLKDPEALRRFYLECMGFGEASQIIKRICRMFIKGAIEYLFKEIKEKLATKAQKILDHIEQLAFIDSTSATSTLRDEYERESDPSPS